MERPGEVAGVDELVGRAGTVAAQAVVVGCVRYGGAVIEAVELLRVADKVGALGVEETHERLAEFELVGGIDWQVEGLDVEVPPDARPTGIAVPGPEEIHRHAVGARRGGEFVELDPIKTLQLRIRHRDKTLRIHRVPPRAMTGQEPVEGGLGGLPHGRNGLAPRCLARKRIGDAQDHTTALRRGDFLPGRGKFASGVSCLDAHWQTVDGLGGGRRVEWVGETRWLAGALVARILAVAGSPDERGARFTAGGFEFEDHRQHIRVDQSAELNLALVGDDSAADLGVPEVEANRAALDLATGLEHQTADGQPVVVATVLGDVGAANFPAKAVVAVTVDHRAEESVAQKRAIIEARRQRFPDRVVPAEKALPIHRIADKEGTPGRQGRLRANHRADPAQRLHVDIAQLAGIVRPDIEREDVTVFHRAEIVGVDLLRRMAEAVVSGQRVKPHRTTLVFGQNGIREFRETVALGRRVLHVRARGLVIVERAGTAHLAEPDVGSLLLAVVEADETLRLERLAVRDCLRMAEAAVADGVVEPDVFDRTILREQLPQLGLLHRRVLADAGGPTLPVDGPGPGPVALGEIEGELDAVFLTTPPQLGQHVAAEGRLRHLALGGRGVPEAEPIVVFGEKEDVAHARLLRRARPLIGVAVGGAKETHVVDASRPLLPGERAERPADEHAKALLLQGRNACLAHGRWSGGGRDGGGSRGGEREGPG